MRLARQQFGIVLLLITVVGFPVARAQDIVSENARRLENALMYLELAC